MTDALAQRANPLRDPRDRRLPARPRPVRARRLRRHRRPGPQEAHPGDLRPRQPRAAAARASCCSASPGATGITASSPSWRAPRPRRHARTEFREEVWRRLADSIKFVPGSFDDDDAFDRLARSCVDLEQSHGIAGQRRVLPLDPAARVPRGAQADGAHRHGLQRAVRRLAPGRGREAVRPRPRSRPAS